MEEKMNEAAAVHLFPKALFKTDERVQQMKENGIKFRWIFAGCYEIQLPNGIRILTDPFIEPAYEKNLFCADDISHVDYILITHVHIDHITEIGKLMNRFDANIICGSCSAFYLAKAFSIDPLRIYAVTPGETLYLDDFILQISRAKHNRRTPNGFFPVDKEKMNAINASLPFHEELGVIGGMETIDYLITTNNNLRLLFASGICDVRNSFEAARINAPDIVIRQATTGQSPEDFARVLAQYHAQLLLPFHHEGVAFGVENGVALYMEKCAQKLSQLAPNSVLLNPKPLQWYAVALMLKEL